MSGPRCMRRPAHPFLILPLLAAFGLAPAPALRAEQPPALEKSAPESIEDLKAIQKQTHEIVEKVMPSVVSVRVGGASGSGVIVSKDGFIMTAGHVSGAPNRDVVVIFNDGKTVKGKTLGGNHGVDSGLIKITDEGEWPALEKGKSEDLKKGQWVIAIGHPGGFKKGRSAPVRLGRVLESTDRVIRTDCTLVGGDSGGPLFDMDGKVVGIHSRIDRSLASNFHIPSDVYRDDAWDRMVKAEVWGVPAVNSAYMGIQTDPDAKECKITSVVKDSPADKAGFKEDDVIVDIDGKKIGNAEDLFEALRKKKPGDEVSVEVRRGKEPLTLKVTLGKRGN